MGAASDQLLDQRSAAPSPAVIVMKRHYRACPMPDAYKAANQILRRAGYGVEGEQPPDTDEQPPDTDKPRHSLGVDTETTAGNWPANSAAR